MYNSEILRSSQGRDYCTKSNIINAAYAVLPNFRVTSSIDSIKLDCGYLPELPTHGKWPGGWNNILTLNSSDITNLINLNGEGLYNFYVLVGDCETGTGFYDTRKYGDGNDEHEHLSININNVTESMFDNATNNNGWNKITNKKLIQFTADNSSNYSLSVFKNHITGLHWGTLHRDDYYEYIRPVVIAYEKVSEGRLYKDIPVKSNSGDSSTTDNNEIIEYEYSGTTSDFDSFINSSYDNANAFIMTNQSIYNYKSENGNYTLDTTKDYSANNPYIYIAKNVDLTNRDNDVFQILFNKVYNGEIVFDINCTGMPQDIVYNPELVTNESGESSYMYNTYNIYHSAKSYFSSANLLIGDESRSAFKINIHGMYDFILIYDEEPNSNTIHVYCRRHESNFIKLFPSKDVINVDEDGFAIHKNGDDTELNTLEWKLECAIGDTLTPSSLGLDLNNNEINFENALKGCVQEISGSKNPIYSNYIVRDYVTSQIVAYFDSSNVLHCNFQIEKNYLLYVEHLSSTSTGNVQNN